MEVVASSFGVDSVSPPVREETGENREDIASVPPVLDAGVCLVNFLDRRVSMFFVKTVCDDVLSLYSLTA